MPSTFTQNFAIEKIATGEQSGSWGSTTNFNLDIFDRLAGFKQIQMTTTTETLDVRPATPTSGASNAEDGMYRVIQYVDLGTDLGSNVNLTIGPDNVQAFFFIKNSLTAGRSIIIEQGASGTPYVLANGTFAILYTDGGGTTGNVISISDTLAMANPTITGGSVTGLTNLSMADAAAQARAHAGLNVDAAGTAVALSIALG